jgi:hypothetical protein
VRRSAKRAPLIVIALVAACSSPGLTDEGFISLGREFADGGVAGTAGAGTAISMGGVIANGGVSTSGTSTGNAVGGVMSMGGTLISQGGTTGVNGGTGTGAEGPSCGSGGMPLVPEPSGGAALTEACEQAGPNQRICLMDGTAFHCGVSEYPVEQCAPGTCETGCCHATADPCPIADPLALPSIDCNGDCADNGECSQAPIVELTLDESDVRIVRVGGSNVVDGECGKYFEIDLNFPHFSGARVTVSPPWRLGGQCPAPEDGQCYVTQPNFAVVFVTTDVEAPPPRNVVIETRPTALICTVDET